MLAVALDGSRVETVESLAQDGVLNPGAAWDEGAARFPVRVLRPGVLMTAKCLLERSPRPTREQVREELSGNLCRRTGYQSLVEGVLAAAEIAAGGGDE